MSLIIQLTYMGKMIIICCACIFICVCTQAQEKDSLSIKSTFDNQPEIKLNPDALQELSRTFHSSRSVRVNTNRFLLDLPSIMPMPARKRKEIFLRPFFPSKDEKKSIYLNSAVNLYPATGIKYIRNTTLEYKLTAKLSLVMQGNYTIRQGKRLPTYIYSSGISSGLRLNITPNIKLQSGGQWNYNIITHRMEWSFLSSIIINF